MRDNTTFLSSIPVAVKFEGDCCEGGGGEGGRGLPDATRANRERRRGCHGDTERSIPHTTRTRHTRKTYPSPVAKIKKGVRKTVQCHSPTVRRISETRAKITPFLHLIAEAYSSVHFFSLNRRLLGYV